MLLLGPDLNLILYSYLLYSIKLGEAQIEPNISSPSPNQSSVEDAAD